MDNRKPRNDDRPIKGNSSGKYNMDFIDWNNEWGAVYNKKPDFNSSDPNSINTFISNQEPSPIYGMSQETFKRLMDDEFERFEYE